MKIQERCRLWHRAWRYARRTEPSEISLVRALSRPGDCVIDIGAHKAAFSYWMAKSVGPRGIVLALEPIAELAEYLRGVATLFHPGQLQVHELALSDRNGTATLHFAGHHLGGTSLEIAEDIFRPPVQVATRTLDALLADLKLGRPISLIKCDVEHHELAVFRGASEMLARDKPILLFESGNLRDGIDCCRPVFDLLESLGFTGHFFHGSQLVPLGQFEASRYPAPELNQNYVFTHPRRIAWRSFARPYAVEFLA